MICLSKALTAGAIPMAVTTFTQEIFDGFYDQDINKALFHGHTFTANPTGCAAALAGLHLLQSDEIQQAIQSVSQQQQAFADQIINHSKVKATRVLGVIMALEIDTQEDCSYYGTLRNTLYHFFINEGVLLRPIGNIIYVLPPYIITQQQLEKIYKSIAKALDLL
jgi:adenosylmethionine-8-amino-7-oxononanoate aminotransferase